jgi:hypothetical protein
MEDIVQNIHNFLALLGDIHAKYNIFRASSNLASWKEGCNELLSSQHGKGKNMHYSSSPSSSDGCPYW